MGRKTRLFVILTTRFLLVLLLALLPSLGGQVYNHIGKILILVSCACTLVLWFSKFQGLADFSLLWTTTTVHLVINARKETARLAPRQQDVEIRHTQTFSLPDTKSLRTPDTTDFDSSSTLGGRVEIGRPLSLQSRRTSVPPV